MSKREKKHKYKNDIILSQYVPDIPNVHWHTKEERPFLHMPPCWHTIPVQGGTVKKEVNANRYNIFDISLCLWLE